VKDVRGGAEKENLLCPPEKRIDGSTSPSSVWIEKMAQ